MRPSLRFVTLLSVLFLQACQQDRILVEQRILSFGTLIDISIATTQSKKHVAEQAIDDVEKLLLTRHHQWHAWLPGDLKSLNQSLLDNKTAIKNTDIEYLIKRSQQYYNDTNGLFNPALGLLISAWGFHHPSPPNDALINKIKRNIPTMNDLSINEHTIESSNPYLQLDFGGIAKGLAIEQIQTIFKQKNIENYLINMGGDINASGKKHAQNWVIGIQNPYQSGAIATLELLDHMNVFTSGNYQRFTIKNKKRLHHIINPRTGEPSHQANAVTVVHSNPLTADVAATALMIAHPNEWQAISQQLQLNDYLIMMPDQIIWASKSFFKKITFNTELKVHIIGESY